ncbi:MAG: molecular chaperone DnaJ [Actinomycetota bacterium]|nr:molecular chaperone DnaJ [Actinomycetota bacterium]
MAQTEWFEKDYYKALGVPQTATENDIRRAYRKLAKQHHPDAHPGSEERFKEISVAYDVLSDAAKRKEYDEIRRLGPMAGAFGGRGPGGAGRGGPGPGASGSFTFNADDLGDLLGGLFGRFRGQNGPGGAGGRAGTTTMGPQRGADLEAELHLSFTEAVNGVTTTVNVTSEATCHTCHGSGAAPGTSPVVCPQCSGRGVLDDNQGFFSFSRTCPRCAGRGMIVETPCPTCNGRGVELRPRQVKVRVPPGVDDGQRIRLKGRGGAGRNGGPPGDLFVVVSVSPHPVFGRKGRDLTLTVPVTFAEAALGSEITVPTLEEPVVLKLPPGTRSGRTFRVRGRGIPSGKNGIGDLLVTVEVAVPTRLSPAEREAIEALAAAAGESPRAHLGV